MLNMARVIFTRMYCLQLSKENKSRGKVPSLIEVHISVIWNYMELIWLNDVSTDQTVFFKRVIILREQDSFTCLC